MKLLHLIRHAKSSWDSPDLRDVDRPLNKRGIKASKVMAKALNAAGWRPELVYTSPAVRARTTIENMASYLPALHIKPQIDETLYTFSAADLLKWCHALAEDAENVTLVGHNPAITDFTNQLTGSVIMNVPTCGYIQMEITGSWADLTTGSAALRDYLTPKMMRET